MMNKLLQLLAINLTFGVISFSQTGSHATCLDAQSIKPGSKCELSTHYIASGQDKYWISFIATSAKLQLITSANGQVPNLSDISLYTGDCASLQLLELDTSIYIGQTKEFVSNLTIGQEYFICLNISTSFECKIDFCVVEKILQYGTFFFTDQNGNTISCGYSAGGANVVDSVLGYIHECQNLNFCITDTICVTMSTTVAPGQISYPDSFDLNYVLGIPFSTITYNSDFTEACLTFNETGTTTTYLNPGYDNVTSFSNNYEYVGGGVNQWVWTGDVTSYMNIHVFETTPEAQTNSDGLLCFDQEYNINGYEGTTITSVSIDGAVVATPNSNNWSTTFSSEGTHYIQYTVEGYCSPNTYYDTVQVIVDDTLLVDIDPCNHATFTFTACGTYTSIYLQYGDGSSENLANFSGTVTWTHDYSGITGPITWEFYGYQVTQTSPFTVISLTYSQSETIQPAVPLPITLTGPQFLCEFSPSNISITSPSNIQNIIWSTTPSYAFNGQGTSTIIPISWPQNQGDILVSVTSTDLNGCSYAGTWIIEECCQGNLSSTEFFERTYMQLGSSSMSAQLPNNYYNGPNQQIAINLPSPSSSQIATLFSVPTSITDFIAANPGVYNAATSTISTQSWIFFNNDLIIDQDVTFDLCPFIRFAAGAQIILTPNHSLYITRSTLAPKCDEMWGGINLSASTENVFLRDASIIGATKGITSTNGGYYQITTSRFIDNHIGIHVSNNNLYPSSSTIISSYFGDVIGQNLLPPYSDEPQPIVGIFVNDINDLVIGTETSLEGNLFHNHQRGIRCLRANVHSYKNNFFNIRHASTVPMINEGDKFCAIHSINNQFIMDGIPNQFLEVGGTSGKRNNFVNCEFGISSNKSVNLDAGFNYMKNCALRGISAQENPFKTIKIYNNEINSTNANAWGIYVKNFNFGNVNITLNQINTNSQTFLGFTRFAAGIYVCSMNPTITQTTSVTYNTVQNCLYGIWMINVRNGLVESNNVNINLTNAQINYLSTSFAPIRGILVQNSISAKIKRNNVTRNMGQGNGVINNNLQAIRLELSPGSEVWENRMYNTAVGFYAYGSSLGSRVDCNQMHFTRNGFYLEQADLSTQGAPAVNPYPNGYDAHNQWYNPFGARTDGTSSLTYYYHGVNSELNSTPSTFLSLYWFDTQINSSNPYTSCIQSKNPPVSLETPSTKRTREILPIAQNNVQYDTLDYQQKHYLKLAAFSRLESDSALLMMNIPEDSIYMNYVQQNIDLNSQSKIIYDAQKAMAMHDLTSAQNACNQIATDCIQYNTNKTVQELWIQRTAENLEFSSEDTLFLMNIACLDPLVFGSGVYQARAMIDWDGFCNNQNRSANQGDQEEDNTSLFSKIYPNPSEGKIRLDADLPIEKVIILDLNGAELCNFTMNENAEIDTNLSTGVYLMKIKLGNGVTEIHRVYIR